jgi:hypothetical protein
MLTAISSVAARRAVRGAQTGGHRDTAVNMVSTYAAQAGSVSIAAGQEA